MRPITATAKIIPPKNEPPLNPKNTHTFIMLIGQYGGQGLICLI